MSDEPPFEYRKWVYEQKRRDAERAHDRNDAVIDKLDEAAVSTGLAVLRVVVVINGGAAVALLAFISSLAPVDGMAEHIGQMAGSLIWFASGVAAAAIGMAIGYLANYTGGALAASRELLWEHPFVRDSPTKKWLRLVNRACHALAIAAGLFSIGFFIFGMFEVEASIALLNPDHTTN